MKLSSLSITLLLTIFLMSATLGQTSEKTDMLYRRGLTAYQAGDFNSAASFFEQTLEEGYSANAAVYLTYIRKETEDFKGALESLQLFLDNSSANEPDLQSYISLKLFLEARIADQEIEAQLSSGNPMSMIALVIAVVALGVSVFSLRRK